MTRHLKSVIKETRSTPQSQPLDENQVANSAGGFSWEVDDWTKLRRFLILGTEGGSYYASEKNMTKDGLDLIKKLVKDDGNRVVDEIIDISYGGIAPKNDYALFALAVAASNGNEATRRYALQSLDSVARTGTHLFTFAEFLSEFGSLSGRAKRKAFANWYTSKSPGNAAYQAVKYRQRNGWTHRDILRVAHPGKNVSSGNPNTNVSEDHAALFNWITGKNTEGPFPPEMSIINGYEIAKNAATANDLAKIIRDYSLPREAVPNEFLTNPVVWQALLDSDMPITAMIRNLGNMTRIGLLTGTSEATQHVIEKITNEEVLRKGRVHPITILFALKTYASGAGYRGTNSWTPVQTIVDALDSAFYKSFNNVEPTGKRLMLSLDISSSMDFGNIAGSSLTPREASAAMALVTAATEKRYVINGFHTNLIDLPISPKMRLDTVVNKISRIGFGGTDCSLPMIDALRNKVEVDAFVIYTDSETWAGRIHPAEALKKYREKMQINAKLIVVGMISNRFSIADPKDPGMLDVVGFDTNSPQVISNFIVGKI